jgi:hypothetical protein
MKFFAIPHQFIVLAVFLSAALLAFSTAAVAAESDAGGEWKSLFNGKDLSGWQVVLAPDLKGIDPTRVFEVYNGVIHTYREVPAGSKVPIGYIGSDDDYSWYHLKLEFRWGEKRFAPRVDRPRDAGILYHARREKAVWPRSIECQIQEGDVGDCWLVKGAQVASTFDPERLKSGVRHFLPAKAGGVAGVFGRPATSRIVKSDTHEVDGWNTVEVILRGDEEVTHIVNGHEVFHAENLRQLAADGENWLPLKSGRIVLQAEFAEVMYRNIRIRPIEGGPFRMPVAQAEAK